MNQHTNNIIWDETFLVTGVTIADKALIMQSNTSSGELVVGGNVSGLMTHNIDASADVSIQNVKEASFIMPWSDHVTVFLELSRFTKKAFGDGRAAAPGSKTFEKAGSEGEELILEPVTASQLIDSE